LATVNVFPDPVTPKSVWYFSSDSIPATSCWIAEGWSPVGLKSDVSLNCIVAKLMQRKR